jgi:hypothetical protein
MLYGCILKRLNELRQIRYDSTYMKCCNSQIHGGSKSEGACQVRGGGRNEESLINGIVSILQDEKEY